MGFNLCCCSLSFTPKVLWIISKHVQNGSGFLVFILSSRFPLAFSLALCLFMAVSSMTSKKASTCKWRLVLGSFVRTPACLSVACDALFFVSCSFTHGLVQEVSSVQTLVTDCTCFTTEPCEVSTQPVSATAYTLRDAICYQKRSSYAHVGHVSVPLPANSIVSRDVTLLSSSHFISFSVWLVNLFFTLSQHSFNSVSKWHDPSLSVCGTHDI